MTKRLFGLRGASGAENTAESITKGVCDMCASLFKLNNIAPEDVVSIQFTMTEDLDAKNPASALRCGQNEIDVSACALFCSQEASVRGMAKGMMLFENRKAKPLIKMLKKTRGRITRQMDMPDDFTATNS